MPARKKAGRRRVQPGASEDGSTIHISIDRQGNVLLETRGTVGSDCDALSAPLESSLGKVIARVNKETYADG